MMDDCGLTAPQTARLCGVDARTVRRWRSGESRAPIAALVLLEILSVRGLRVAGEIAADSDLEELRLWLGSMVRAMNAQGEGMAAIHRRLGCGYGNINRLSQS